MPPLMLDPVLGVATAGLVVYWVHPIAREQDLPIKASVFVAASGDVAQQLVLGLKANLSFPLEP